MSTQNATNRPEAQLLLCCTRTSRNPETTKRIETLVGQNMDWEYVLRMAYKHRVASLLCWHLDATFPEAVPEGALNRLRSSFRATSLRNLILTEKLVSLLQAFEAHGIPAVPFKGPVLAATVYDNLALREFIDLDILVHRQDVPRAKELLISLGYRPEYELTSAQEAAFLKYERELTFAHDDASVILELHWQVAPRSFSFSLDTNRLWDQLSQVSLGGSAVLAFSPEDLLLFLCVHGADHLWARLGWTCDVAELVRVHEDMDWDLVMRRANASGSKRMLFLGLLLASDLLGADLPNRVSNNVRSDATVRALAAKMRELMFQYTGAFQGVFDEKSHFQPLHLQMMERNQDRVHYCIHQATAPVLKDWVLWPLPAPLFPLYRIFRPMRLARRYAQVLLKRIM